MKIWKFSISFGVGIALIGFAVLFFMYQDESVEKPDAIEVSAVTAEELSIF